MSTVNAADAIGQGTDPGGTSDYAGGEDGDILNCFGPYGCVEDNSNVVAPVAPVTPVTNEAPVLVLAGNSPVTVGVNSNYVDSGAIASDQEDGDITSSIIIGGDVVDTSVIGTYTITYDVTDSDGNTAPQVVRVVNVVDQNPPVINLIGESAITLNSCDDFTDLGATASDVEDGDLTSSIVVTGSTFDTCTPGTYEITYDVSDSAGNTARVTRVVTVVSKNPPVLTLVGGDVTLTVGDIYADAGATATDKEDGDLTSSIIIGGDTVNPNVAGTYIVTYNVIDSDGNSAPEVTRTVTVKETEQVTYIRKAFIESDNIPSINIFGLLGLFGLLISVVSRRKIK